MYIPAAFGWRRSLLRLLYYIMHGIGCFMHNMDILYADMHDYGTFY